MEKDIDKLLEVWKGVVPWPYILMKESGHSKILMIQANQTLEKTSVTTIFNISILLDVFQVLY